ncbi:hypothetical protein Pan97_42790 [Bremerella volcania]|uniref:Uncharacterized protein n=1 Tax=Bremerella volcania TaxID=2527984 RepID=A0A518CDB4_9BACT|nr:hypothetical protein [Bremerella volcania]QDU77217.1 hypothetical protein Pan97_42790 [Bremerella volcania]
METNNPPADATESQPLRRRFRFSVLTILLVTAIVGLSLAYFRSSSELLDAKAKLNDLRRTYELIDVKDNEKIYVLPMKVPATDMWQWRVYLPEGARYCIHFDYNSIPPKTPKPTTRSKLTVSPGTYVITQMFTLEPTSKTPKWRFNLSALGPYANVQARGSIPREELRWLEADMRPNGDFVLPSTEEGVPGKKVKFHIDPDIESMLPNAFQQTKHEPDQAVDLLRWEVDEPRNPLGQEPSDYLPLEVLRLWIEREKPPKVSQGLIPCPLIRQKVLGSGLQGQVGSYEGLVP